MRKHKLFPLLLASLFGVVTLSGCAANLFEEEINVVFKNEGKIVDSGVVTQFTNYKTPTIDESYVPTDYRFLGWTTLENSQLDLNNAKHFKTQYISAGRMVHYNEAKPYSINQTTTYRALIMHKDRIPKDYHYVVIAWYDKTATSGINSTQIGTLTKKLKAHLKGQGVSDADISTVVIRGYTGNVGPSCGQIMYDGDVDIMLGWGNQDNVINTGGMTADMLLQSEQFKVTYNGAEKTRYLHRLTATEASISVMQYLLSDEVHDIFN